MSENQSVPGPKLVLVTPDSDPAEEEDDLCEPEVVYIPRGGCFKPPDVLWKVEIKEDPDPDVIIPVIKTEAVEKRKWWEELREEEEVEQKVIPKLEVLEEQNTTTPAPEGFQLDLNLTSCPICLRRFRYSKHLKDHFRHSHEAPALFKCGRCEAQYRTQYSLDVHVAEEHVDLIVKKENCGEPDIKTEVNQDEHQDVDEGESGGNEDDIETEGVLVKAREQKRQNSTVGVGENQDDSTGTEKTVPASDNEEKGKQTRSSSKRVKANISQAHSSSRKSKSSEFSSKRGKGQAKKPRVVKSQGHSNAKEFQCTKCGKKFSKNQYLKLHLEIHSETRPWSCDICGRAFRQRTSLTRHHLIHSNTKKFSCDICQKSFRTRSNLTHHSRVHKDEFPYTCSYCSKGFRFNGNLKEHLKTHTKEKPHGCKICGKRFARTDVLQIHIRTHSQEKRYKCTHNQCSKAFTQNSSLYIHLRSTHSEVRAFKCSLCEKAFKNKSSLIIHAQYVHEKGGKHECNFCSKKFVLPSHLTAHLKVHENTGRFFCSTCDLKFTSKGRLDQHLRGKVHSSKPK